jgi:hypothetical protein
MSCFDTPNCEKSFEKGYLCIRGIAGSKVPCKCVSPKGKPPAVLQNAKHPVTAPKKPASVPSARLPPRLEILPTDAPPQTGFGEETNGVRQGTGQAVAMNVQRFASMTNLPLIIAAIVLGALLIALTIWHNKHKPKHRR